MKEDALLLDGHKLHYHPDRVAAFLEGRPVAPLYAEVSPTARCSHRCVFCNFNHLGHRGAFPPGRLVSLMDELAETGVKSVVFAGAGEPTLHRDTFPAVRRARQAGMDVAMSTNGSGLGEEDLETIAGELSWIRFSFNAGSPGDYARVHGTGEADYYRVLDTIGKLGSLKEHTGSRLTIGTQFLLLPENSSRVVAQAGKMKALGADYFVVKHFYRSGTNRYSPEDSFPTAEFLDGLREEAAGMTDDGFSFIVRAEPGRMGERSYNRCYGLPFIVYIREDCRVYTCFFHQDDDGTALGSVADQTFGELWRSSGKDEAIEYINRRIDKGTCQENCRHHRLNTYLWSLRHHRPDHVNFI